MYSILLKNSAKKFLKKLDRKQAERIIKKIKQLKQNPKIGVPLAGSFAGFWKLRVGDYRIIYRIIEEKVIIIILKIGHRKNIYD